MLTRTLLIVTAGLLIAADAKDDAVAKEKDKLKGTWQVTSVIAPDGKKDAEGEVKDRTLTFSMDKVKMKVGKVEYEIPYKIDPSKTPKEIDMGMIKDIGSKSLRGIYEVDGDTLKLCICEKGTERPKGFKVDKDSGTGIMTLKREKK